MLHQKLRFRKKAAVSAYSNGQFCFYVRHEASARRNPVLLECSGTVWRCGAFRSSPCFRLRPSKCLLRLCSICQSLRFSGRIRKDRLVRRWTEYIPPLYMHLQSFLVLFRRIQWLKARQKFRCRNFRFLAAVLLCCLQILLGLRCRRQCTFRLDWRFQLYLLHLWRYVQEFQGG